MSKDKQIDEEDDDSEQFEDFMENFNQLELLETHRHLIPVGTQSCWSGQSDDDDDEQERSEEWYEMQEKKMEKNPEKLLLWAAENNRVRHLFRSYVSLTKSVILRRYLQFHPQTKIYLCFPLSLWTILIQFCKPLYVKHLPFVANALKYLWIH